MTIQRPYIPAAQVPGLFRVTTQRELDGLNAALAAGETQLRKLDGDAPRLRPEVFREAQAEIRRQTARDAEKHLATIEDLARDAQAQIDGPYQPEALRRRQRFAADDAFNAQIGMAVRAELEGASIRLLLSRAERAAAEGSVAVATAIGDELERRASAGRPIDGITRERIRRLAAETTNDELQADLEAKKVLVQATQALDQARLRIGELTGTNRGVHRIALGVRKELGV